MARIVLIVLLLVGGYFILRQQNSDQAAISLKTPPNSETNQIIEVPLVVDVPTTINAGEFVFQFPTDLLQVKEIKKDGSFYQLWVKDSPSFSNTDGTVSLAGGLPSPGFTGTGTVAVIVFETKAAGTATITLVESKSRLLANDGLGTVVPAKFSPVKLKIK